MAAKLEETRQNQIEFPGFHPGSPDWDQSVFARVLRSSHDMIHLLFRTK
jgi:hypothetical protein